MLGNCGFVERSAHAACQFQGVVVGPKVDEEHAWLLVQHVTMDRRYLDIAGAQRPDQRIDLTAGDEKVAGDGGFAAAGRLKIDGVGAAKRGTNLHSALL